jgi:hypothetical protein
MQRLLICVFRYHSWPESCIERFVSAGFSLFITAGTHGNAAARMMPGLADVCLAHKPILILPSTTGQVGLLKMQSSLL